MVDQVEQIKSVIKQSLIDNLHTSIPATIVNTDNYATEQTINVQPVIAIRHPSGSLIEPPILYNVPVQLLSGGGAIFSVPLAVGDIVTLHFQMSDIDQWKVGDGSMTAPFSTRGHSINDAIAVPCLATSQSDLKPDATDLVIKFAGSEVRMKADGDVDITSTNVTVNATHVDVKAGTVDIGDGAAESIVLGDSFAAFYDAHVHSSAGAGPPTMLISAAPALVLSQTVKVKS